MGRKPKLSFRSPKQSFQVAFFQWGHSFPVFVEEIAEAQKLIRPCCAAREDSNDVNLYISQRKRPTSTMATIDENDLATTAPKNAKNSVKTMQNGAKTE